MAEVGNIIANNINNVEEMMGKSVRMNALNNAYIDATTLTITGRVSIAEHLEVNWANKGNSFMLVETEITNPGASSGQVSGKLILRSGGVEGNLHYIPIYRY